MTPSVHSPPGILRKCTRCGHFECAMCGDYCDSCLETEPQTGEFLSADGLWVIGREGPYSHVTCANEMACDYGDAPQSPEVRRFLEEVGFHVSISETEDGGLVADPIPESQEP